MQRANAFVIALLLGAAVVIGSVAALKTAELKGASAQPAASARAIARRNARLDKGQISLRKALARRPPKLPSAPALLRRHSARRRAASSSATSGRRRSSSSITVPAETRTTTASMSTKEAAMTNHVVRLYALAVSIVVLFRGLGGDRNPSVAGAGAANNVDPRVHALVLRERRIRQESRSSCAGSWRGAGAITASRSPRETADHGCAAPAQAGSRVAPPLPSTTFRAGRDPAAADRHEDVVMERHEFSAMGTEVELMLDLPPGRAVDGVLSRKSRREFGRIEKVLFAVPCRL